MNAFTLTFKLLNDDLALDKDACLKTIVFQEMLYSGMYECRCFMADGKVYSALYEDGDKITLFVEVPPQEKK